jgi:hypothetical protein
MQNRSNPDDRPGNESVDRSPQDKGENTPAGNAPPVWPGTQYFRMQRAQQITDSHCGPATIQMLFSNIDINVTQQDVAMAAGVQDLIEMHGIRVDQMAQAVRVLAPGAQFWYKQQSTLDDLAKLVLEHKYPVGMEWQGLFEDEGEEDPEPDYGHYSVITHMDLDKREVVIVDPYQNYVTMDRIFSFDEFLDRWWDYNVIIDPTTGNPSALKDDKMMFIITPREETFPEQLHMSRG